MDMNFDNIINMSTDEDTVVKALRSLDIQEASGASGSFHSELALVSDKMEKDAIECGDRPGLTLVELADNKSSSDEIDNILANVDALTENICARIQSNHHAYSLVLLLLKDMEQVICETDLNEEAWDVFVKLKHAVHSLNLHS